MNTYISIIVNTCDNYEELWEPFFCALKKNWAGFNYQIILNTEKKTYSYKDFDINCYGSSSNKWGERFLEHLKKIKTKYVLILFDDYLINKEVCNIRINNCIKILEENDNVAVCYLVDTTQQESVKYYTNKISKINDENELNGDFQLIPNRSNYRLNSAPGIWRVKDLIKFTSPNDTPWVWEFFGSARTYKSNKKFYCVANGKSNIVNYVNDNGMGGAIHRGEWLLSAVEFIEMNLGLQIKNKTLRSIKMTAANIPHTLSWKMKFLVDGFRAVGIFAFIYLYRAIKKRILGFYLRIKNNVNK